MTHFYSIKTKFSLILSYYCGVIVLLILNSLFHYVKISSPLMIAILIGTVLVTIMSLYLLRKHFLGRIHLIRNMLDQMANGNYEARISMSYPDEIGEVFFMLKLLQNDIRESKKHIERNLESLNILGVTIDNTQAAIMIADKNYTINYINHSALKLFQQYEPEFQEALPNFQGINILGHSMDIFHSDQHRVRIKEKLQSLKSGEVFHGRVQMGNVYIENAVTPIYDKNGQRTGTAVEWFDQTINVLAQKALSSAIEHARTGDFSVRLNEQIFKQTRLVDIADNVNLLLKSSENFFNNFRTALYYLTNGDFTHRIETNYEGGFEEIKENINATSSNLDTLINQVHDASHTVQVVARQILMSNSDLSMITEQQHKAFEEIEQQIATSVDKLRQNNDYLHNANETILGSSGITIKARQIMANTQSTMTDIHDGAKRIVDITGIIDSIAFQTNILALNAAVEAARAGESGKGFAVVAGEVRYLAQRSAKAANQIKELISTSVSAVENGKILIDSASDTMTILIDSIQNIVQLMKDVMNNMAEQNEIFDKFNSIMSSMHALRDHSLRSVERAVVTSNTLDTQAQMLTQAISVFKCSEQTVSKADKSIEIVTEEPASASVIQLWD